MAITLAITNSKGGVGKTTTCCNLGAALAAAGKRVLLVDNDPQGDLTKVMRADPKSLKYTLANLMNSVLDDTEFELFAEKAVVQRDGVDYIPANSKLAAVSSRLVALQMSSRYRGGDSGGTPCELVMACVLKYFQDRYDYILIDCGHSMDLLTINALAAANRAIVPVQAHYLAMEDMADTLEVIRTIRQGINPALTVGGILLTMYQGRTNLCRSIQDEIQADYQNTMQHKAIKLMASKLAVAGIIEGSFSEEGLAAMSECEDMTTLMAKELMLGIKDSVEDVSEMFKRMANLKPQAAAWSIFAESPTPMDNTVLEEKAVTEPLVEFTFGEPAQIQTPSPAKVRTSHPHPALAAKPSERNKTQKSKISEDQILLFKIA